MNNLTWKEFKELVDEILKKDGKSEDAEIWYIDISFPTKYDFERGSIDVHVNEQGLTIG